MKRTTIFGGALTLTMLAACGGGGGGADDDDNPNAALVARFDDAVELAERVADQGQTTVLTMPTTQTATYTGIATGLFEVTSNRAEDIGILGDATLLADFDAGTITGSATNFTSVVRSTIEPLGDLTGTVSFDNGTFGGSQGSVVTGTFNGTLTGPAITVVVDDEGLGSFRGSAASGVAIQTAEGGTVNVDGTEIEGSFGFSAER